MLVSWILTFFGLLMVPMMGVFCVVHLIFIANGYTTFEFLKLSVSGWPTIELHQGLANADRPSLVDT